MCGGKQNMQLHRNPVSIHKQLDFNFWNQPSNLYFLNLNLNFFFLKDARQYFLALLYIFTVDFPFLITYIIFFPHVEFTEKTGQSRDK